MSDKSDKALPFTLAQLEEIEKTYPTPFHLYDERGIRANVRRLKDAFAWNTGFKEYFAVKACPNPFLMKILKEEGLGMDCSSLPELLLSQQVGVTGEGIMFTSNDTPAGEFVKAKALGAVINLDDLTHIPFLEACAGLPERVCLRYNPGPLKGGNAIIGNPEQAKYGFTREQLFEGYRLLKEKGVKRFGLHTMVASNELNPQYFIDTAEILFDLAADLSHEVGITFEFVNIGGGIGIPYRTGQQAVDLKVVSRGVRKAYEERLLAKGHPAIRLYMECGRMITGPYGFLVSRVRHIKKTYKNYAGLDACMADLMRPALYGAYHHVSVPAKAGLPCDTLYDVTGSLCENNDKFAIDRLTVYMIGEGSGNNFRLNDSELLTTNQFEGLVSGFQWQNPIPVNIILDFSGSGAFIPCLADQYLADEYPSATRVSVASAGSGREALFANNGTVSFSQYLLAGIINGETLGDAYTAARRAIRRVSGSTRQRAELDDTLNGMSNEKNVDRLLADETHVGCSFVTGADMPVIGNVMPAAVLAAPGEPITLWASEVAGMYPVSNVWCTVTPPGYSGTGDLPVIELHWNSTTLRYEADSEAFILPGSYGLTFYARDTAGEISAPVQSEVILADAFEPDDTDSQASLYHGLPQIHTFHTSNDVDWARFYLVTNLVYYDIETFHLSDRLDTVIDLYRQLPDGSLEMLIDGHVDYEGSDLGEYTGIDVTESGWYWARISAYAAGDDTIGTYEFSVYTTAADGLNSLIILGIDDVYSSALPEDSTATVEGYGEIEFDGSVFVVCSGLTSGTYLVTVPVPENFMPREDPDTPDQIASLTNLFYANPRLVTVEGGWAMAGFEMLSTLAVTSGVVRDAWTGAFLADAQIAFTGASGNLTGTVADGSVILTSYRDQWQTAPGGSLPEDITLGACDWHLALALKGYHTNTLLYAVSNAPAGSQIDLGTVLLEPLDTNENGVADAWEDLHFPGGLDPDADSDDDGISNKDEYFCGTDPNDPDSVLRFLSAEPTAGDIDLSWSVAGGRNYEVLAVTSLTDTAVIATNGPWEAAHGQEQMQWTDTVAPLHKTRFYRLRLNQF